jgi:hypothetical protein
MGNRSGGKMRVRQSPRVSAAGLSTVLCRPDAILTFPPSGVCEDIAMKLNVTLCVFLLSLITSLFGQDHAPTVEQCRADQRLWAAQLDGSPETVSSLTYYQLNDRMAEMADCVAIDDVRAVLYSETGARFNMRQMVRLRDFVKRHELYDQFIAEDAAGKR